eukprot:TRINITY_DN2329_c0_g1_i4.p1 TRINITY_DN2329_c0_g1~~TRINITY_DN2329_c0_g1_i4.p1  ORF type:complete len:248 (-),score=24.77 TRINITY_DN2329_c0_g1_i4:48-791(-)
MTTKPVLLLTIFVGFVFLGLCQVSHSFESPKATKPKRESRANSNEDTIWFNIEHSLSPLSERFKPRGRVGFYLSKTGRNAVEFENEPLSAVDTAQLQELIHRNGYYRVRFVASGSRGNSAPMVSLPACALSLFNFEENFDFYVDGTGHLIGATYLSKYPFSPSLCANQTKSSLPESISFQSTGKLASHISGERPAVEMAAPASNPAGSPEAAPANEPGFIRKYWYILLPVFIVMFCVQAPAEPQQQS